jgi:hypothetical protein
METSLGCRGLVRWSCSGGNIGILGILQYSWILKFLVFVREGDDLEFRTVVRCGNARDSWVEEVIGC